MENIINYSSQIMIVIAVICTLISVITEFTKDIPVLKKIPTKFQVLILSIIICAVAFFAYIAYAGIAFVWYYLVAVLFASFVVAAICCFGWDFIFDIWKRFYRKEE